MYFNLIKKDIRRSRLISLTIAVFVLLATALLGTAADVSVRLVSSIDHLFEQAQTPHLMQMHAGTINPEGIKAFAESHALIEQYQISEFLNLDGAQISLAGQSLADSVQDNGLTVQNPEFDYLLNLEGERIAAQRGEVYVPIYYMREAGLVPGDQAVIAGQTLRIAGFVRDSQMNAALVSSKRFVVHADDFNRLKQSGSIEYLIEFRLTDSSQAGVIETDYINQGLEADGPPAITYRLFRLINLVNDGMMIAVLVLISILVIVIALLCIRFTVLAQVEEDYREVGILKALGIRQKSIRRIYLAKYIFLAGTASAAGFGLSFVIKKPLIRNLELYLGKGEPNAAGMLLGLVAVLCVFGIIIRSVRAALNQFKKISPAQAIRYGAPAGQKKKPGRYLPLQRSSFSANVFLSIRDLLSARKVYWTMLAVYVIAIFLILVPLNLYHTISDRSFIQYMGLGDYDLRMDLSQMDHLAETSQTVASDLAGDPEISQSDLLISRMFDRVSESGRLDKIKVELGNHQKFPVHYLEGHYPQSENEIALSKMNAEELELSLGGSITLLIDGRERSLNICGIYADITNGGKTAKANFSAPSAPIIWAMIPLSLSEGVPAEHKTAALRARYPFAKISSVPDYIDQTFGGTQASVGRASAVSAAVSLLLCFILTLLFMRMIYIKNKNQIALLKAVGYRDTDIRTQFLLKAVLLLIVSAVFGIVLANTLGSLLGSKLLSMFGASGVAFRPDRIMNFAVVPLIMCACVLPAAVAALKGSNQLKISELIKE